MTTDAIIAWERPTFAPILSATEIHLWCVRVIECLPTLDTLQATLSVNELTRASQYRFARDRDAFIVARGMLRTTLGNYLAVAPADLRFDQGPQGKPFLPDFPDCQFNLSHTDDLIVCAVTKNHILGIDVERVRPDFLDEDIAEHYFSALEITKLHSLPFHARPAAFFRCWTRKEAYIKARAEGLSFLLNAFSVSFLVDETPALLHVENEPAEITRWSMHHFLPASEFIGAVVTESQNPTYKYYRFAA